VERVAAARQPRTGQPSRKERSTIPPLSKLTDRGHDLSGIAPQPVDTDNNDGVAFACVVQQRGKAGALLARRCARQLVAVDAASIDACRRECIDLLVEGLMPCANAGISELNSCGSNCDGNASGMSHKSQNRTYCAGQEIIEVGHAGDLLE
jgi:hypothetical protein